MPTVEAQNPGISPFPVDPAAPVQVKQGSIWVKVQDCASEAKSTLQLTPLPLDQLLDDTITSKLLDSIEGFLSTAALSLIHRERKRIHGVGDQLSAQKLRELAGQMDAGKLVASAEFHDRANGQVVLVLTLDPKKGA